MADPTAPSKANDVQVTANDNSGSTFSLLVANQPVLANLETSVKVKVLGGKEAQVAGLVWRYQDPDNYYVAAWNKADNALDLWRVKDGKRKRIGTAAVGGETAGWHEIRVEMNGDRITAYFDGKKVASERDFTFVKAGKVGFWVPADSRAAFDDLTVTECSPAPGNEKESPRRGLAGRDLKAVSKPPTGRQAASGTHKKGVLKRVPVPDIPGDTPVTLADARSFTGSEHL